jgi:hypothetical protein
MRALAYLFGLAFLLPACATMVNSEHQSVLIITDPPEAEVWVDNKFHIRSPGKVAVSRQSDHIVLAEKEGYEATTVALTRSQSRWVYLNITCVVFIYHCVKSDLKEGGYYTFEDEIVVKLNRK